MNLNTALLLFTVSLTMATPNSNPQGNPFGPNLDLDALWAKRSDIQWTDDEDVTKHLPEVAKNDKGSTAFRDIFGEILVKKIFNAYMTRVRHPLMYGFQLVRDPLRIKKGIHFTKKEDMFRLVLIDRKMICILVNIYSTGKLKQKQE